MQLRICSFILTPLTPVAIIQRQMTTNIADVLSFILKLLFFKLYNKLFLQQIHVNFNEQFDFSLKTFIE